MLPFEHKILEHLESAVVHFAFHKIGEGTIHYVKHRFFHDLLKNHDVAKALHESYIAAMTILEKDALKEAPKEDRKAIGEGFSRLRSGAEQFFSPEGSVGNAQVVEMLENPGTLADLVSEICAAAGPLPEAVRNRVRDSFPDAFAYSFKEIGIKGNEKVRAVITHQMLNEVRNSGRAAQAKLADIQGKLGDLAGLVSANDSMRQFEARFGRSIEEGLRGVSFQVAEVKEMLKEALEGGRLVGYAMVFDKDGNPLTRHPLKGAVSTIGRDEGNTIPLAHGGVSGRHAELRVEGNFFILRDLGSRNGTYIGTEKIKVKPISFGVRFKVGPFAIELLPPGAATEPYIPPQSQDYNG
jgi:hypothetical protein